VAVAIDRIRGYYLDTICPNPPSGYTLKDSVGTMMAAPVISWQGAQPMASASESTPSHPTDRLQTTSSAPAP
jgi:hypothetical protein